jgi:hypothetical protein
MEESWKRKRKSRTSIWAVEEIEQENARAQDLRRKREREER